MFKTDKCP